MAIEQISRITHRTGLHEELPQLHGSELGWAIDNRKLYIGNGTIEEGAPVIGNTEILTEFSDLLAMASGYTYKGQSAGYIAQTGPNADSPVNRSVQAKLDDIVSVRDFGAVGDGIVDDTDAINRALYQVYCRGENHSVRRGLYFPAGLYRVSNSINVPPYATLYGDGMDSTVIRFYTADISVECVIRTADSYHNTGVNMGNSGAVMPTNIDIRNLTVETTVSNDVMHLENVTECHIENVGIRGYLDQTELSYAIENSVCVRIKSNSANVSNSITLDNCTLSNSTYGLHVDHDCKSLKVTNSTFKWLHRGAIVKSLNGNPTGVALVHNVFDHIHSEAICFGDVSMNLSAYNMFYDVGNEFRDNDVFPTSAITPVISMDNPNNASISDMFERTDNDARTFSRVEINSVMSGYDITHRTQHNVMGSYYDGYGKSIQYYSGDNILASFSLDKVISLEVTYVMESGDAIRKGRMMVSLGKGANQLTFDDEFTETDDMGVVLDVVQDNDEVSLMCTANVSGKIHYKISHF